MPGLHAVLPTDVHWLTTGPDELRQAAIQGLSVSPDKVALHYRVRETDVCVFPYNVQAHRPEERELLQGISHEQAPVPRLAIVVRVAVNNRRGGDVETGGSSTYVIQLEAESRVALWGGNRIRIVNGVIWVGTHGYRVVHCFQGDERGAAWVTGLGSIVVDHAVADVGVQFGATGMTGHRGGPDWYVWHSLPMVFVRYNFLVL